MKVNTMDMRRKVLNTVACHPKAAEDDKFLIALIWLDEGWDHDLNLYANLLKVSSPETIRRTRQKLQQEGLIKPSEKSVDKRYSDYKQARIDLMY